MYSTSRVRVAPSSQRTLSERDKEGGGDKDPSSSKSKNNKSNVDKSNASGAAPSYARMDNGEWDMNVQVSASKIYFYTNPKQGGYFSSLGKFGIEWFITKLALILHYHPSCSQYHII